MPDPVALSPFRNRVASFVEFYSGKRDEGRAPAEHHRDIGDVAADLVRQDAELEKPPNVVFAPTLMRALAPEQREALGLVKAHHHLGPALVLRAILEQHDDPAVIARTYPVERQRNAILRPFAANILVKAAFRWRDHFHLDGVNAERAWQRLSPAARGVFPPHMGVVFAALAKVSPDGEIRFARDCGNFAHSMMRADSLFTAWLLNEGKPAGKKPNGKNGKNGHAG